MPIGNDEEDLLAPEDEIDVDAIVRPARHAQRLEEQRIEGRAPDAPLPNAHVLEEQRIEGTPPTDDSDLDEASWWEDALAAARAPLPGDRIAAADRTARRIERVGSEAVDHPVDTLLGGLSGMFGGTLDDLVGQGLSHPRQTMYGMEAPISRTGMRVEPPVDPAVTTGAFRGAQAGSQLNAPHAYDAADSAGAALAMAALPEVELAEGTGAVTRAGVRALEGGAVTGAMAAATSDAPDLEGRLEDAAEPALYGTALGGGMSLGGSALRGVARQGERIARDADRARLASVLGERRAPITDTEMQTLVQTLGRGADDPVAAAADAVREAGIVGPMSTVEDIAEAGQRLREERAQPLRAVRQQFEEAGGRVPVDTVPAALEQYAQGLDSDIGRARYAGAPRAEAEQWRSVGSRIAERHPDARAVAEAERELAGAREQLAAVPPPPTLEQARAVIEPRMQQITAAERAAAAAEAESAAARSAETTAPRRRPAVSRAAQREAQAAERAAALAPTELAPGAPGAAPRPTAPAMDFRGAVDEGSPGALVDQRMAASDAVGSAYQRLLEEQRGRPSLSLSQAEQALRDLDRSIPWVAPGGAPIRIPAAVAQGERRAIRDALDDVVAERLGPEVRESFPRDRRRWQAADTMTSLAERRAQRAQMRSPIASAIPMAQTMLQGGAGAAQAVAGGALGRALRAREASMIAAGYDAVRALMRTGRAGEALGSFATTLERAAERGPDAMAAAHYAMMRSDPAYAERVAELAEPTQAGEDESDPLEALFDDGVPAGAGGETEHPTGGPTAPAPTPRPRTTPITAEELNALFDQ